MKKNLAKALIVFCIVMLAYSLNNVYAVELQVKEYSPQYQEWLNLSEEEKANKIEPQMYTIDIQVDNFQKAKLINTRLRAVNSTFDLRDEIDIILKNQEETNECWAFSTTTLLETNGALTDNITNVQYSTRHMNYSTSNIFLDGINQEGHNRNVSTGANSYISTAYMASGRGPILESEMPFANSMEKINLSEIQNKTTVLKLEETINFPTIYKTKKADGTIEYSNGSGKTYSDLEILSFRNQIKEHIMQYGAVMGYTYAKGYQYYNNQENYILSKAYYCDERNIADHAVSIIGWDDNYAVTNFNEQHRPTNPGAYIVQNSWGKTITDQQGTEYPVLDNGCIYISYEDFLIEESLYGIVKTNKVDYDYIYQYDPLGFCTTLSSYGLKEIYYANVFERNSTNIEKLNEISIMGVKDESYDIYINSTDGELGKSKLQKIKTVSTLNKTGYYTIKFDTPIVLTGSKYVVAIKATSNDDDVVIPIEAQTESASMWSTATSNLGESFFGDDIDKLVDLKTRTITGLSNINVCIKAFTTVVDDNTDIIFTSTVYKIDATNNISKILPNTTVQLFKSNIVTNSSDYTIKKDDETMINSDLIGTSMIVNLSNGMKYHLIVVGDVNGDGEISIVDVLKIKRNIIGIESWESIFEKAGDVNESNNITIIDLVKIKRVLIGMDQF